MAKQNTNFKKGFTIIEVVLVLAIAGLIFLMAFVALPALQRSQRDTQRRNDYAMLSTAITNYMTNNRGSLPAKSAATALNTDNTYKSGLNPATYLNSTGEDPNGFTYKIAIAVCKSQTNNEVCTLDTTNSSVSALPSPASLKVGDNDTQYTTVYLVEHADCSGTSTDGYAVPTYNAASRAFAIYGPLETTASYCSASS